MKNVDLRYALIRKYGSQLVASLRLKIPENKISRFVQGHNEPNERERAILTKALGRDFFSKEGEGPQAA
jgi:hypothetical protein